MHNVSKTTTVEPRYFEFVSNTSLNFAISNSKPFPQELDLPFSGIGLYLELALFRRNFTRFPWVLE